MNIKEARSILDMIRDAGKKELIILSLLLLPIILGGWVLFLNSLDFLDQHNGLKLILILFLLALYFVGLISMKKTDTHKKRLERARYHVETRLKKRGGNRASFDAIRDEVNEDYSDDFLKELIEINPKIFVTCKIKRSDGNRDGITLV
jgi:hypothetical protein